MTHGDPSTSWRGGPAPPHCLVGAVPGSFPANSAEWGERSRTWRILGHHNLGDGSRSSAVPGHVDSSAPDMMGEGTLPSGLFPQTCDPVRS